MFYTFSKEYEFLFKMGGNYRMLEINQKNHFIP